MSFDNFRVPPDSTGKKISTGRSLDVIYDGGTRLLQVGEEVTGGTNSSIGLVEKVVGSTTSGYAMIQLGAEYSDFVDDETILVNGSTICIVNGTPDTMHTQHFVVVGGNNHFNGMFVDREGSAHIRHPEGPQQLDAFGVTRVTTPNILASLIFDYDDQTEYVYHYTSGAGSHTHLSQEKAISLDVGTASGDLSQSTTHRYHLYQPGFGHLLLMTVVCGDTGKTGVRRRWGYFDDNNGVFFQLNGTDLELVVRSNATGSVVDTTVSRTDWNGDKVDGTGGSDNLSTFNLDVSKNNIYWIDFQWLGAGRVRFGVYDDTGNRQTLHSVRHANALTVPFMGTPTLPVRWEIENTALAGSPSRLKGYCYMLSTEGDIPEDRERRSHKHSSMGNSKVVNASASVVHGFTLRSTPVVASSIENRQVSIPELLAIEVVGDPILLQIQKNAVVSAPNFTIPSDSAVEVDVSGVYSSIGSGREMFSQVFNAGMHNLEMPDNFSLLGENLKLKANGSTGDEYVCVIKRTATASANASSTFALHPAWIDLF